MAKRPTVTKAIEEIQASQGFITTAARKLGISRATLHTMINQHPKIKEAVTDAREGMKDLAEAQLFKNIRDGKETSLIFYLKTQGRERGYVEKSEIDHTTGGESLGDSLSKAIDKIYGASGGDQG